MKPTRAELAFNFSNVFIAFVALCALVISAIFTPETLPKMQVCGFMRLTGKPCPGCGLTRAFCSISHGDFPAAYHFNPFSFLFYAGALLLLFWPLIVYIFPAAPQRFWKSKAYLIVPVIMVAMVIFGIARMFTV